MRLPGFAAHISLDRGTARYRMAKSATPLASGGKVLPQGCYYLSDGAKALLQPSPIFQSFVLPCCLYHAHPIQTWCG